MKTNGWALLAAVCFGAFLGACARNVIADANAQTGAVTAGAVEYKVVGASMGIGGYEEDLNKMAAQGWRYTGTLPFGQANPALVFERAR